MNVCSIVDHANALIVVSASVQGCLDN